jgi:hypothetical protein
VRLTSISDQLRVWIVDGPGLPALAAHNREALLDQVVA